MANEPVRPERRPSIKRGQKCRRTGRLPVAAIVALCSSAWPGVALAHTGERAYILLLPTDLYMIAGVLVVALSFLLMALVPAAGLNRIQGLRWHLVRLPSFESPLVSFAVLIFVALLIVAGFIGSRDPLDNPLPTTVWSLWWVGFTFLQALFGNLWAALNPWHALYRLATAVPPLRTLRERPPLAYPDWLGYWPAIVLFFAFAWFELIYPAPQDPARLASAMTLYGMGTLLAMLLFGEREWLHRGEAFTVFFRIVAWLSPFGREPRSGQGQPDNDASLYVTLPGLKLLGVGVLPLSGMAFVLLALASVSFDGLSRTFWWLDLVGENPLEYPGRSALVGVNSLGLLGLFGLFLLLYGTVVLIGRALARDPLATRATLGHLVVSIVPIAFGYHFAHYLPAFLVDAQYALRALSDPFALGWNLLGTSDLHVTASLLTHHESVELIWNLQAAGIVGAHVAAVAVAHLLALRAGLGQRQAIRSQVPMTLLMIGYTLFGLWLLASPAAG